MIRTNGRSPIESSSVSSWGDAYRLALVGAAYFLAHELAFLFPDAQQVLMAIWPAGGIGLAALLLNSRRLWPAIAGVLFITGTAADLMLGRTLSLSIGFMAANTFESLACAWFISWRCPRVTFARVEEVVRLIGAASVINAGTSFLGAGTAAFSGPAPFWSSWFTWWVGDGLGILLVAPFIVTWARPEQWVRRVPWVRIAEWTLFMSAWCAAVFLSFRTGGASNFFVQPYMVIALLAWAALRIGPRGVMLSLLLLAAIAIVSDAASRGPLLWGGTSVAERLLQIQVFVACAAATGMLLAASYAEAKAAGQASRDDQARLRALGDNLPNGMVYQVVREHDGRTRFLYVSAGVESLNGVSAAEVLRDSDVLYRSIVDEDRSAVAAAEEESARTMTVFNVVARFRRPDGQVRWMHMSSAPRRLEDGRILWDGLQLDITDRRQAEEHLRETEARLQRTVKAGNVGLWEWDLTSSQVYFSREWKKQIGYDEHEIRDCFDEWQSRVHPDDLERTLRAVHAFIANPWPDYRVEFRFRHRDGSYRWILAQASVLVDANGRPQRMLGSHLDITDRKRAEDEIRFERDRLTDIFKAIPDGISIIDKECNVQFVNPALEHILGRADGRKCFEYLHDRAEECPWCRRQEVFAGNTVRSEYQMANRGRFFDAFETPLKNWDCSNSKLTIVRDITDQKRSEEERERLRTQIHHAQKLESLGVLAGGIAHDFNNILLIILGNAQLALQDLRPETPVRPCIEEIETAVRRAADLTRQMLAYSGRGKFVIEALSLSKTIRKMHDLLKSSVCKKASLRLLLGEGLPAILADSEQIQQIVMNLILNASEALDSEGGGVITVATGARRYTKADLSRCHSTDTPQEGDYVYLEVSDTGSGMNAETKEKLFDPFYTTKFTGRGLGMSAVLGIVRSHNGAILLESAIGQGTTVRVLFPALDEGAAVAAGTLASVSAAQAPNAGIVLLVDDEPALLDLGKRMIERLGYHVITASDGIEAVELYKAKSESIVCVVLDLSMPRMDGEQALREIRRIKPDGRVILASGYSEQNLADRFVGQDVTAFIQKPYSFKVLSAKLSAVLSK